MRGNCLGTCWLWLLSLSVLTSAAPLNTAQAQPPQLSSAAASSSRATDANATSPVSGGGGGADFTELMTLIQQTIDPDAWIDNSSVMAPFPSGVYIDPAGQLRQLDSAEDTLSFASLPRADWVRHPWRTASPLRVVSLRQLDLALERLAHAGLPNSLEHTLLAGLSHIDFVHIDLDHEDVLLAGPADGARGDDLQGFRLADLGLLMKLINSRSTPLGCSIDPTDAGILAAQQLLNPATALKRLAIDPQKFVGQMQDKIGPHAVRVFGMPAGAPAAVALVAADEHMKQLGFGTARTAVSLETYFEHLDRQADVPTQSLIRWWFTYAEKPIRVNAAQDTFQLPEQGVTLLSEQQWVSVVGRKATGAHDVAADAFAAGLTAGLPELRRVHPAYARMCAIFESALALQLAVEATGQPNLHAWFPNLKGMGECAHGLPAGPDTVSGLTTWHRLKHGTVVAVVSGGVQINARARAGRQHWQTEVLEVELPLAATLINTEHGPWWWD